MPRNGLICNIITFCAEARHRASLHSALAPPQQLAICRDQAEPGGLARWQPLPRNGLICDIITFCAEARHRASLHSALAPHSSLPSAETRPSQGGLHGGSPCHEMVRFVTSTLSAPRHAIVQACTVLSLPTAACHLQRPGRARGACTVAALATKW